VRPYRKGFGRGSADLNNREWQAIQPLLPKSRGIERVDDRRVLNGILWRLRTGRSWAQIPAHYGRPTTCQTRFIRWRDAGLWARIVHAAAEIHGYGVELIDAETAGVPASCARLTSIFGNDHVVWRSCKYEDNTAAAIPGFYAHCSMTGT
jgi:transposase